MYHEGVGKISFWLTFVGTLRDLLPHAHRRASWACRGASTPTPRAWAGRFLNALEIDRLLRPRRRAGADRGQPLRQPLQGPAAGNDPWGGDTLEWSTTSPPPPYNYPVIPTVSSPYAMWDKDDRERDNRRLDRGEGLLDARPRDPGEHGPGRRCWTRSCPCPRIRSGRCCSALSLAGIFAMLLLGHFLIALGFLGVGGSHGDRLAPQRSRPHERRPEGHARSSAAWSAAACWSGRAPAHRCSPTAGGAWRCSCALR